MSQLPRLYPIIDAGVLDSGALSLPVFAEALRSAGVTFLQYRDKDSRPQAILRNAAAVTTAFAGSAVTLIMNDRADLALLAGWDGVHVGQEDLSPKDAKAVLAAWQNTHLTSETSAFERTADSMAPARTSKCWMVGLSTHTEEQMIAADAGPADYVAVGPVFATGTKLDASPVVGLDGVRRVRALTRKPLVAIGGISRKNAASVITAGADSVAVISGFFAEGESVEKVARDFIEILG